MESPFDSVAVNQVIMYIEPIRNEYYKTYQNVITLSAMPPGPIAALVRPMNPPKLSEFQSFGAFAAPLYGRLPGMGCVYALMRYPAPHGGLKTNNMFMVADDLPNVCAYLEQNGYRIDTRTMHSLAFAGIQVGGVSETRLSGNRKPVCSFRYIPSS